MRFVLFTDKTIPQCVSAIHERIQTPASANRPAIGGYVEKSGRFSLALTSRVVGRFTRTTRLEAQVEREGGSSMIRGTVADGAGPRGQVLLLVGFALIAALMLIQREPALTGLALLAGGVIYLALRGDYENSEELLMEIERTLKASPKPPKPAAARTTSTTKAVVAKSPVKKPGSAVKSASVKRPAPKPAAKKTTSKPPAKKPTPATYGRPR